MLLTRTVDPSELITAAELKAHLRIDHTYDDDTVTALQAAVSAFLDGRDGYLNRAVCTQTWAWRLSRFPVSTELHLPLPPLQSVTSVQYYDTDEVLQTFDSTSYYTYAQCQPGYIKLKQTYSWPSTYDRDDAVIVTFVAGHGSPSSIPKPIKQAALMLCGHMYANRGDAGPLDAASYMSDTVRALLAPYRVQEFNHAHERYWYETRAHPLRPPV